MDEYDSPWKEALDEYFEPFLQLCFPTVHLEIDWARGYEPLDKELQKIAPVSETGRRVVDKLMRVCRNSGHEEWILVHVEVQSQSETVFPERMFVYHYRLRDRYNRKVASLAVLGDNGANWRPDCYRDELLGCWLEFHFPIVKLLDYANRTEELEKSDNPFAIFVLAHLKSQETMNDLSSRYVWKFRLVKRLYEKGWSKEQVRCLFRFIDWILILPPELEEQFSEQLSLLEEDKQMPYVTSIERLALKKGREEGIEEGREEGREEGIEQGLEQGLLGGIESVLEIRFGAEAGSILTKIRKLSNVEVLGKILQAAKTVDRPEDLADLWTGKSDALRRDDGE